MFCWFLYNYLNTSPEVSEFLAKANESTTHAGAGLFFYILIGLTKIISIICSTTIPLTIIYLYLEKNLRGVRNEK